MIITKLAVYQTCYYVLIGIPWKHTQMLHKIIRSSVDVSLPSYITHRTRHTRGSDLKFIQPDTTIDAYKYSFFPTSIRLWNNLPRDIISCNNLDSFKEHLNNTTL